MGLTGVREVDNKLRKIGVNYVSMEGGILRSGEGGIPRRSAGHPLHEWTSWSAMEEIFRVMKELVDGEKSDVEKMVEDDDKDLAGDDVKDLGGDDDKDLGGDDKDLGGDDKVLGGDNDKDLGDDKDLGGNERSKMVEGNG